MIIQITGVTSGTSPYDVFLCDTGYTSCFLISGSCQIPPTVTIETDNFFPNYDSIGVKLIDSNGCIYTENKVCPTCFYYRLGNGGGTPIQFTFTPCCGETETSPYTLSTFSNKDVCSSTLPTASSGTVSLLPTNCPSC
jgi:hypothetical protein